MRVEEEKFIGIVLNVAANNEDGCRLSILSAEGKNSYVITGVKKPKAKLKFAAQPFALCEFMTVGHKVIGATSIETFFDLTKDTKCYWAGCVLLKAAEAVPLDSFLLLINSLKALCIENISPEKVVTDFLVNIIKQGGYDIESGLSLRKIGNVFESYFEELNILNEFIKLL